MREKIRRFTKEDWYAYAGAEKFGENSDPWIYEQKIGECELTAIADKNSIQVMFYSEAEDDECAYIKQMPLNAIRAQGELIKLADELAKYDYAPDLTYALDHPDREAFKGFECVM